MQILVRADSPPSRKKRGKGGATPFWEFRLIRSLMTAARSEAWATGVSLLFRLRQLRNNCGNFIEYLVPALHLTAVFRALHGFVSNEGEFRPAVPEILKEGHVVRAVDRLMVDS